MAKLTIGVPVYNEKDFIRETLDFLCCQTSDQIRILVADNGSTDGSRAILQEYQTKGIEVIFHPENIGSYNNFIFLLQQSDTPFFAWLGAHDLCSEGFYKEAVHFLEQHDAYSCCFAPTIAIDQTSATLDMTIPVYDFQQENSVERFVQGLSHLSNCSCFHSVFRAEALHDFRWSTTRSSDKRVVYHWLRKGKLHYIHRENFYRRYFYYNNAAGVRRSAGNSSVGVMNELYRDLDEVFREYKNSPAISDYILKGYQVLSRYWMRHVRESNITDLSCREYFMYLDAFEFSELLSRYSDTFFFAASKRDYAILSNLDVYIYGHGFQGLRLAQLLQYNNVQLAGFLDSYVAGVTDDGVPIYVDPPTEGMIIIASDFKDEILTTLLKKGHSTERIRTVIF